MIGHAARTPSFSILTTGIGVRAAVGAALVTCLWIATWWALGS